MSGQFSKNKIKICRCLGSSLSLCPRTHKVVFLPPHPSNTLVFLWFCALKIILILNICKRKLALWKLRAIIVVYIYLLECS